MYLRASRSSNKEPEVDIIEKINKEQQIEGQLVLKEGKIYISKKKKLRIIWLYHDILAVGYGGQ